MTRRSVFAVLLAVVSTTTPGMLTAQRSVPISSTQLSAFQPRSIGPAVTGGRIHDVEALPGDPSTIFIATASGGLWKSTNRGHQWRNVFADMPVSTFGDVAISESIPDILYAGTGGQNNRQSTSWGNGVYRSNDMGESWTHLGLVESRHIGRIQIDPTDPDRVFVAALGNLWAAGGDRGVFRSLDGGQTWENVLFVDDFTGAVDLVMDPTNPNVLYAATYQRLRRTWGFNGGGPGSGIFKTVDGGATWTELTNGIPGEDKGRIGLAISRSNPSVLNALVQTADPETTGTYRSEDAGVTWERVNALDPRPMYYSHIVIDPTDDQRVYVLSTNIYTSSDGGRTYAEISPAPTYDVGLHRDQHALWIDPSDPEHLYLGGDAGAYESYDRGASFRKINNLPIGQFYDIGVDMKEPYNVFGGMQDNHSWMGPSETRRWVGIVNDDWQQTGSSDGMNQQPIPGNDRYLISSSQGGSYTRVDVETGDIRSLRQTAPAGEAPYRFDWTSPLLVSQHDPNTIYLGGNRLFVSLDGGETFEASEDLSRNIDRDDLELMGVPGSELAISPNDGTSSYGEITAIAESPFSSYGLWIGTDDGNVLSTRDAGATWENHSGRAPIVPNGTYVSRIVMSREAPGRVYVVFDAHRDGDFRPYVYRTVDAGFSWEPLTNGLPEDGSVNSFAEHPDNSNVLVAGTERGVFVSTNAGDDWARLPGLPTLPVDDLIIHPREKDLVIGTHGGSIWIVDDIGFLAEWTRENSLAGNHLGAIGPATIFSYRKDTSYRGHAEFAGDNPLSGALITYSLGEVVDGGGASATLRITNAEGDVVRTMGVPSTAGIHRVNWDLRHNPSGGARDWEPHLDPELSRPIGQTGAFVSPGLYTVALEARDSSSVATVEVRGDPLLPLTQADYENRESFMLELEDLMARAAEASAGIQCPRGFGAVRGPALTGSDAALCRIRSDARRIYSAMMGSGAWQGSLYPPTVAQQNQKLEMEAILAGAPTGR